MLLVAANLFWVRGNETAFRIRARIARSRLRGAALVTGLAAATVFVSAGAWIFYNTNVLNPYRNEFDQEALRAEY